ncbi:MAG: LysE/ArgO family amino acid transporter [Thiofilum sp.]|uniref:LysE/ArgO family amino acid transporter n=1 Tax=Thiofilum sp. TaxID=2212733 RepID=UPI0025F5B152|nr:LysE/ArgO family amino acid transporter [Thiofilum sp.]MBK8455428.1 amino acid transporter [Thiofilum sp.]
MSGLALLKGFGMGGSLIMAIGSQNAFVLSNAIRNQHIGAMVLVCVALDTLLIWSGVWGLGALIQEYPPLITLATWGGAAFLALYGTYALQRALKPSALTTQELKPMALKTTVLTLLALSLLNPHVYLDTVVLLGSIGGQLPTPQSWWFALGASLASLCWFITLGWGGRLLAPWFANPKSWQILDLIVAATMWILAILLLVNSFNNS